VRGTDLLSDDPRHRDGQVTIAALWLWTWSRSDSVEVSRSCVCQSAITVVGAHELGLDCYERMKPAAALTEAMQGRISPLRQDRQDGKRLRTDVPFRKSANDVADKLRSVGFKMFQNRVRTALPSRVSFSRRSRWL
jgi:hypothetical protein